MKNARSYCSYLYLLIQVILMPAAFAVTKPLTIVTEHFPPLQIVQNNQVTGGLATEIVQAMLLHTGDKIHIQAHNWARTYKIATEQENVMIFSITRNAERAPHFKWVGSILSLNNYLWRLKSRSDIKIETLEQAKNYTTAVPRNDVQQQALHAEGFTTKHLATVTNYDQAIAMLIRGRVDLIAGTDLLLNERLKHFDKDISLLQKVIDMDPQIGKLQIAFSLKTADHLVEKYRNALQAIKDNGTYDKIMNKWREKLNADLDFTKLRVH